MIHGSLAQNPKLTIGIPAYRNEKTIRATIESILGQSYGDFKVIISDDVSPDGTADICRELAAMDERISFLQQRKNLNYGNFRYLVKAADTEYFMWLAGDDTIAPDYLEENLKVLESREDIVLSVTRCLFLRDGVKHRVARGTYPLMGSVEENILKYLFYGNDNARMYGIFRSSVAKRSFPEIDFHGYDIALSINSLLYGKHYEIPEIMMFRDWTPTENYFRMMHRDGKNLVHRLLPSLGVTLDVWRRPGFPRTWRMLIALATMNLRSHSYACRVLYPRYAQLLPPLLNVWDRHFSWRANPWQDEELAEIDARPTFG